MFAVRFCSPTDSPPKTGTAMSGPLMIGSSGTDFVTDGQLREVSENHTLHLSLQPHQGLSLLLTSPERLSRGH